MIGVIMFSDATYNRLKWIAMYLLPSLGTLYFTCCGIWNLPYGEQVLGTITALDTFLGVLLGISKSQYTGDGTMIIDTSNPEKDIYRMELDDPLETLGNKDQVIFKVKQAAHMRDEQ